MFEQTSPTSINLKNYNLWEGSRLCLELYYHSIAEYNSKAIQSEQTIAVALFCAILTGGEKTHDADAEDAQGRQDPASGCAGT